MNNTKNNIRFVSGIAGISAALLCFACKDKESTTAPRAQGPAQTKHDASTVSNTGPKPSKSAEANDAETSPSKGYAQIPGLASKEDQLALSAALRVHREGDYTASKEALLGLVTKSPSNSRARYNLACALSRLGEVAEAAKHYEILLQEDMPHYRGRLSEDKDLEAVRNSPANYKVLTTLSKELESKWQQESRDALPMIYWRGGLGGKEGGSLRAGVWNPDSQRFLPLGRDIRGSIGALVDLPNRKVLTITRRKHKYKEADEELGGSTDYEFAAAVHPLYGEGPAVFSMKREMAHQLEVFPVEDGIHVRWFTDFGMEWFKNNLWKHKKSPLKSGEIFTGAGRKLRIPEIPPRPYLYSEGSIVILRDGGQTNFPARPRYQWTSGPTQGYRVKNNELYVPSTKKKIKLSRGHGVSFSDNLTISESGSHIWVLSQLPGCKHLVDRIDLSTGQVSEVGRGDGLAAARFHKGKLYLQLGPITRVFDKPDSTWEQGRKLPSGIGFLFPRCS